MNQVRVYNATCSLENKTTSDFSPASRIGKHFRSVKQSLLMIGILYLCVGCSNPQVKNLPTGSPPQSPSSVNTNKDNGQASFLFVQIAAHGKFSSVGPQSAGEYKLELFGVAPETIYFSDRPARIAGTVQNPQFLKALGFTASNPPNAAVVLSKPKSKKEDVIIAQLLNPLYENQAHTLTYQVRVTGEYKGKALQHWMSDADAKLPANFDDVSLFIDDCPDRPVACYGDYQHHGGPDGPVCRVGCGSVEGGKSFGFCFDWPSLSCLPCRDYTALCSVPGGPCDGSNLTCLPNQCATESGC